MSLPSAPPKFATWSSLYAPITRGETGWRVFALQRAIGVGSDGIFGPATAIAVARSQRSLGLTVDGVVGPKTQLALLRDAEKSVHIKLPELPTGVLAGFASAEGADLLAATNWTVPGGVDCGPVQRRVSGPPFSQQAMMTAFDARQAFIYAGEILLARIREFHSRRPSMSERRLLEVAVLAHNWPAGADQIIRNGQVNNPDSLAMWASKPGGGFYTRGEWAVEYPNRILKEVV